MLPLFLLTECQSELAQIVVLFGGLRFGLLGAALVAKLCIAHVHVAGHRSDKSCTVVIACISNHSVWNIQLTKSYLSWKW